jgi:VanZ family protein
MTNRVAEGNHSDKPSAIRRYYIAAYFMWAVFVVAGSWYPFQYRSIPISLALDRWAESLQNQTISKSDLAINVLLGFPLGLTGLLGCSPRLRFLSRVLRVLGVFISIVTLAVLVELGQNWFGNRVPAMSDSIAQLFGGLLGITISLSLGKLIDARIAGLFDRAQHRSFPAILDLYVIGYCFWMMMPFVPSLSRSEIKEKWSNGMIQLSILSEWNTNVWQAMYTALTSLICAIPIGAWFSGIESSRGFRGRCFFAATVASGFIFTLECIQVFVESRSAQAADAFWGILGAILGVLLVHHRIGLRSIYQVNHRSMILTSMLSYLVLYYAIALAPFDFCDFSTARFRAGSMWTDLGKNILGGNNLVGAPNLIRTFLFSAPLGILGALTLVTFLRPGYGVSLITVVSISITSVGAEFAQIFSLSHNPGILDLLSRFTGCCVGFACAYRLKLDK